MASGMTGPDEPAGLHPILQQFDNLIKRSARRASFYITGSNAIEQDLAQDVRLHLARALKAERIEEASVPHSDHQNATASVLSAAGFSWPTPAWPTG
jgi:hypothetical protein